MAITGTRAKIYHWFQAGLLLLLVDRAAAVERYVRIEAPATVAAGQPFQVVLAAGTDAGQGEQVGFLQADLSVDGGKVWTPLCYLTNLGASTRQGQTLTPGPAGSTVRLRLRVAFRDGLAGDVDFNGAALRWQAGWADWAEPPARLATIAVKAP
jgi:hypothetical protein